MDKLVIIDGNSLINRAFYALPLLSNSKGEYSNGVYGFANILIKAILDIQPKYIAVALDYGKKTFRNSMYDGYKAKRKPTPVELSGQFPILREMLKSMGVCYIEKQNYEADDIIGTLSKKFDTKNIIITGDRDALQLIDDKTEVWLTKKGITETKVMTEESLFSEMALKPYQIVELKSLMGDSSDNIPGVGGVGEKTALDLLSKYTTLEGVYENIDSIQGKLKEKLLNDKEQAFLSKQLATINTEVPLNATLDDLTYKYPFSREVYEFFKNYEFNSLIKKEDLFEGEPLNNKSFKKYSANRIEINDVLIVKNQIKHIRNAKKLNFELNDKVFAFSYDKNCEFYCKTQTDLLSSSPDLGIIIGGLKEVLEDESIEKSVYDLKTQKHIFDGFGVDLQGVTFDAILAYYLLCAGERDANKQNLLNMLSLDETYESVNLFYIKDALIERLKQNNLLNLYKDIEFPLIAVLYDMEKTGFKIDKNILSELYSKFSEEVENLSQNIRELAGFDFNLNSPKQLSEILFDKLGLVCANNKKRSTSIEYLEEMADMHPIVPEIIKYRKTQKILSTYIEPYQNIIARQNDSIIHTMFNQTLTSTGRLSSSEPNLQNLPVRDNDGKILRKMFTTRHADGALVSADYSQIELRLLAQMSNDEVLINAFNNNIDIHALTASDVFNVNIQDVTPQMRRTAKAVNFGIIYGISEYGLSQNINTSFYQAKSYIDEYFKKYPSIKAYMENNVATAKETGYAYSLFGRRRKVNELFVPRTRMFGERVAMNMPLQGTASDIIKLAMIHVYNALKERNLKSKLVLQVHDELIIDATGDELELVAKILKENMENAVKLSVPLSVDVNTGKTLYDC